MFNKKNTPRLSSDFIIIVSLYSNLVNILTIFNLALPMVLAGNQSSLWATIITSMIFIYSIVLCAAGLRPNDETMIDTILGDIFPKWKIPLIAIGQLTSAWNVICYQFVSFSSNVSSFTMAFSTRSRPLTKHTSCIIYIFIAFIMSSITRPDIFVPLISTQLLATLFGFAVVIYWTVKNSTPESVADYKRGWSERSANWLHSNGDGVAALFSLVGVVAGNIFFQSMIQAVLVNAKNPKNNVRNTIIAFIFVTLTYLFTLFVPMIVYGNYGFNPAIQPPSDNLVLDMGTDGLIRANNIISFIFSITVIPLQWAIIRQNTIKLLKLSKRSVYIPLELLLRCSILLAAFAVTYTGASLQILIQIASFPAALIWGAILPFVWHIWHYNQKYKDNRAMFWIMSLIDVLIGLIIFFTEIIQFITKW